MEQRVIFEEKITLTPKDMNRVAEESIDSILLEHLREKLENKCSHHGFVLPRTLSILSRSMGQLENGRFTSNILFHVQAEGTVLYPVNGMKVTGEVLMKNKMALVMIYKDAIRILIPRDNPSHYGNDEFESIEPGETITVEIRKSRFQIYDQFITSIAVLIARGQKSVSETAKPTTETPAAIEPPVIEEDEDETEAESSERESAPVNQNQTTLRSLMAEA